jgi:putative membrane-bound dehydrogenase-like protein
MTRASLLVLALALVSAVTMHADEPPPIKILFLGDNGHHRPAERFRQLQPILAARGIDLTYTDKVEALNPKTLASYDGLLIYANTEKITPEQEQALLDYVASGKGFIPIHCASFCFLNSPKYIELVGAQFKSHQTGTFRVTPAAPDHPVMKGYQGFESWDETYVHTKHNEKDRTVLEYRVEGKVKEPWTWVRTHGKGRVFYTAWGHDERTWGNPGFQNLIERGIRWAAGGDPSAAGSSFRDQPEMTAKRTDVKPFEYVEANIPFYPPGEKWGTTSNAIKKMQKPLDPEESMKHVVYPADFELKLFATEKQLGGKPICMNWDERGRLWVCITMDYPNEMQPEGKGRDRILILEDTDGDGLADKVTVFADKLSIPTSLTFANGGVVVHQAPHTLFLKDTNGDDVADERKVLFTGWSTSDTHAGPSNLQYGLDNWLYGIVGYAGFSGEVGGARQSFRQGFYRFKPPHPPTPSPTKGRGGEKEPTPPPLPSVGEGGRGGEGVKLEFLRNTNNNSWGVGFSEEGLLFGSTANGNPSVYMPIANRYYESVRGWSSSVLGGIAGNDRIYPITDKVRQVDWHGHFTAGAGHALYTARNYPRDYWNRTAFVAEPTGHLVATFVLKRQGTDFTSRNTWNLLASDDEWTAPTMAEVGPDGNVWIIDWYNFIVQHNPTPPGFKTGKGGAYESELRDKKHGRIYRLVAKTAKPSPPFSLKDATADKLVETLRNNNMFWRKHAQRLLVERHQHDVVPALLKLVADPSVDEIGLNVGAIHALWTLRGLGALDSSTSETTALAAAALKHESAGVRRNAVLVLPHDADSVGRILKSGVLSDPEPHVRLAALLALAEMPTTKEAGAALAEVLERPENMDDRWLPDAVTSAAAAHALPFLQALTKSQKQPPPKALDVVAVVSEHYARGGPVETVEALLTALPDAQPKLAEVIVAGLAKGWPKSRPVAMKPETEKALAQLLPRLTTGSRGQLLQLAGAWGSKLFEKQGAEIARALLATVEDEKATDSQRLAAAQQLLEFRATDLKAAEQVLDQVSARTAPALAGGLIDSLGSSQAPGLGAAVLERLPGMSPAARAAALRLLLRRPESTRALLDGLEKGKVQASDLALDQKQALLTHPDRAIAGRSKRLLESSGGLPNPDRQKVVDQLLPLTKRSGDPAAGKLVFQKHCTTCHMHSGEGAQVGPDLTGVAVHPKDHLLIDIMDPSRSVEGNYRVYTVTTVDGKVLTGLLASETKTSIELIDVEAKKRLLLRDNIEQLTASPKSLMPEGFEKQLSETDVVNLLEFLTHRGQYFPLSLEKVATIVSTQGMFYSKDAQAERLIFPDWKPKTFKGVPFYLVDPKGDRVPNVVLLNGPQGEFPPKMPKSVKVPCRSAAKAIHLLSGVSGWGFPLGEKGSVSLIVRLHYADGKTEDHALKNGEHFADYIRRVDVPKSEFAFPLRGQQVRYLAVVPERGEMIEEIEFLKGEDRTAPVIMAVTVETR